MFVSLHNLIFLVTGSSCISSYFQPALNIQRPQWIHQRIRCVCSDASARCQSTGRLELFARYGPVDQASGQVSLADIEFRLADMLVSLVLNFGAVQTGWQAARWHIWVSCSHRRELKYLGCAYISQVLSDFWHATKDLEIRQMIHHETREVHSDCRQTYQTFE